MDVFFDFEKPIATLEKKLTDLRDLSRQEGVNLANEISVLEKRLATLIDETYSKLSPWQRVQLSRHPNRPYAKDYIEKLFPDFQELHGDRLFSDDRAIMAGVASWPPSAASGDRHYVMIIAHQKGRSTKQKMERNFGMAKPEGYRKAIRLMKLAERSQMPIITFIDTPGAYPGLEAEERGQAEAIAEAIRVMFTLTVPVISVVIGEGGSGGALAIGVANHILMQEFSTYSVISPESCASILWSDSKLAERAAEQLKMNPPDLLKLGVIDEIISEPGGGAHRNWETATEQLRKSLVKYLTPYLPGHSKKKSGPMGPKEIREHRMNKFRVMGEQALAHSEALRSEKPKKTHKTPAKTGKKK